MILRNLSMIIQLLFFLGISAKDSESAKASKRGPLDCETYDFQCCWVIRSWEKMNGEGEIPITSCCTLEEVLCDESGMVKEIDWTAKGLEGNIPDDLAHLTHLTKLDLSDNDLKGPVPESLKKLVNEKGLELIVDEDEL